MTGFSKYSSRAIMVASTSIGLCDALGVRALQPNANVDKTDLHQYMVDEGIVFSDILCSAVHGESSPLAHWIEADTDNFDLREGSNRDGDSLLLGMIQDLKGSREDFGKAEPLKGLLESVDACIDDHDNAGSETNFSEQDYELLETYSGHLNGVLLKYSAGDRIFGRTFILETNLQSWKPIFFWKPIHNFEVIHNSPNYSKFTISWLGQVKSFGQQPAIFHVWHIAICVFCLVMNSCIAGIGEDGRFRIQMGRTS